MEEHSENLKQLQTQASVNLTPTPQRQRTPEGATPATFEGLPPEVYSLTWPTAFLESPRGERLELTEEASHATRSSGITKGVALVGPLSLERGLAYFEVEVAEMESKCSQSMALGFCPVLPETRGSALRAERARELRRATLLGYDLPKIYADGQEAGKINTKQWRPLKDLSAGSRIGLLIDRNAWELTVFMNGCRKVTVSIPTDGSQRPTEVWGIVDIHGNVRSVRLRGNSEIRPTASPALPAPPQWALQAPRTPARLASTQEHASTPLAGRDIPPRSLFEEENPPSKKFSVVEVTASAKKRLRLSAHPCGCIAHLLDVNRTVIHLPRQADFVIGRNPQCCNLVVDSKDVPNMVSRRHAVIVSADDSIMIMDCESVNGTFVNGRRVARETLRQGDQIMVGNPQQSPKEFQFEVSMPSALDA
ncbi:nipblb [Symbiodinium sp. CCMP2592]|nr:nipblb [Symbiodinium sp. CCMP2592]